MHEKPRRRRWPRFGLKSLFILVTISALWTAYSVSWIRERREFVRKLEADSWPFSVVRFDAAVSAPGLLWLFGEQGAEGLVLATEPDMAEARRLFPEAQIDYLPPP